MLAVTLNPGFVLILAALVILATPSALRSGLLAAAAAAALWLLLFSEFGASAAFGQVGLTIVPRDLDTLNRIFGISFLICTLLLALYANERRDRQETAAIALLAGASVSGLFVGDLVSLIAAASLAGFAAAWTVLSSPSPGAPAAGVRLLIWHGLEGLLFLAGLAFHLSAGAAQSGLERLDSRTLGGGFFFAALLIRVGAPFAHVWVKDAVGHATGAGGAALSVFSPMLGIYALARLFPAETALSAVGLGMIAIGAFYVVIENDLRRAAAYGLVAHVGVSVALIGVGSPLALAGAAAHAFTTMMGFALMHMALGAIAQRRGEALQTDLDGLARLMPVTALLLLIAGLNASGAPGFGLYASLAVALETSANWDQRWLWLAIVLLACACLSAFVVRPALSALRAPARGARFAEAPFSTWLAGALAGFFCVAIGLAPAWLYQLTPPSPLMFDPFAPDRIGPQMETLGAAGAASAALTLTGLAPRRLAQEARDVDAFYRGPVAALGRWIGAVLLRVHGAAREGAGQAAARFGHGLASWSRSCDRPYADNLGGVGQFAVIFAVVVIILVLRV